MIGVPSNDFGQQEPGTSKEIKNFCEAKLDKCEQLGLVCSKGKKKSKKVQN